MIVEILFYICVTWIAVFAAVAWNIFWIHREYRKDEQERRNTR